MKKIKPGAKVRVHEKTGSFEGLVISRKHGSEPGATFAVRTVLKGVGVEKTFPIHSPSIKKVDIISSPKKIHRAKLYFVRGISDKKVRQKLGISI